MFSKYDGSNVYIFFAHYLNFNSANKTTPPWLSSFVCNSFSSLHFFWKYESKLKSIQVYKGEEHNLTLSLREIYPLVLTIELKEFELLEGF